LGSNLLKKNIAGNGNLDDRNSKKELYPCKTEEARFFDKKLILNNTYFNTSSPPYHTIKWFYAQLSTGKKLNIEK
jgi:hypothetical protein